MPVDIDVESAFRYRDSVLEDGGLALFISQSGETAHGIAAAGEGCIAAIEMPVVHPLIVPLVYAVPVQLLAYPWPW